YRSGLDTNRLEELGFKPLQPDLKRIDALTGSEDLLRLLADFHARGVGACFSRSAQPDAKNSSLYAFYLNQGGLGLPDRDYYRTYRLANQREAYVAHISKMFRLIGEDETLAKTNAGTVLEMETILARASKSRVELRDPIANYHKFPVADVVRDYPNVRLSTYLEACGVGDISEVIIRQPDFFKELYAMAKQRPLDDLNVILY